MNSANHDFFLKAAHYCGYQERCHKEVRAKLTSWKLSEADAGDIILRLMEQNFLNEERFARAFAGGKFRTKKWGRLRIVQELKMRDVSAYCIQQAMTEIDEADYIATLSNEIRAKEKTLKEKSVLIRNNKVARAMMSRGYEPDLIWTILRNSRET